MSLNNQITVLPLPYEVPQFSRNCFHSHGAVNFSLLSKALITAQHKKFVAKIMRLPSCIL
jgi:hypothetical protein